jgi:hypothetical protein
MPHAACDPQSRKHGITSDSEMQSPQGFGSPPRKEGLPASLPLTSSCDLGERLLRLLRKFEASDSCMKIFCLAPETENWLSQQAQGQAPRKWTPPPLHAGVPCTHLPGLLLQLPACCPLSHWSPPAALWDKGTEGRLQHWGRGKGRARPQARPQQSFLGLVACQALCGAPCLPHNSHKIILLRNLHTAGVFLYFSFFAIFLCIPHTIHTHTHTHTHQE